MDQKNKTWIPKKQDSRHGMQNKFIIPGSIEITINPKNTSHVHKTKFSKNGMTVKNWNEFLMRQLNQ